MVNVQNDGIIKEMMLNQLADKQLRDDEQLEQLNQEAESLQSHTFKNGHTKLLNDKYICGHCDQISSAIEINATTLNDCMNRKQRRAYVPIEKTKQTDRKWYRCPICTSIVSRYRWKEHNECPGFARFIKVSCSDEGLNIEGGK